MVRSSVLGAAVAALLVLAGCGDDDGGAPPVDDVETTLAEEAGDDGDGGGAPPPDIAGDEICEHITAEAVSDAVGAAFTESDPFEKGVGMGVEGPQIAMDGCVYESDVHGVTIAMFDGGEEDAEVTARDLYAEALDDAFAADVLEGFGDEAFSVPGSDLELVVRAGDRVIFVGGDFLADEPVSMGSLRALGALAVEVLTGLDVPDEVVEVDGPEEDEEEAEDVDLGGVPADEVLERADALCDRLSAEELATLLGVDGLDARGGVAVRATGDTGVRLPSCAFESDDLRLAVALHDGSVDSPPASEVYELLADAAFDAIEISGLGDRAVFEDPGEVVVLSGDVVVVVSVSFGSDREVARSELEAVAALALDVLG